MCISVQEHWIELSVTGGFWADVGLIKCVQVLFCRGNLETLGNSGSEYCVSVRMFDLHSIAEQQLYITVVNILQTLQMFGMRVCSYGPLFSTNGLTLTRTYIVVEDLYIRINFLLKRTSSVKISQSNMGLRIYN